MAKAKVKVNIGADKFVFYHPPGAPGRRFKDGEIIDYEIDTSKDLEKQLPFWAILLEKPKGKPGPKPFKDSKQDIKEAG